MMRFTESWLRDHLESKNTLGDILAALPMLGFEVESVVDNGAALAPFTIAKVVSAGPHPNADKLKLCKVETGSGETIEVVCGAPNARAGMIGVFAPVGTYVPGIDITLTEATIRGVQSRGMLCSEKEMMISDDHDGIIDLPDDAPIGKPYAAWAGLDDPVVEIAITPNRGDCLGVRGIARDLAAAGLGELKPLAEREINSNGASRINWKIDLPEDKKHLVPRVAGRTFTGVANGASPAWMQQRLRAIGQRPISALVDITNYVMFDLGRPLHAYDIEKLAGDTLTIRLGKKGESVEALNGTRYEVDESMLVIGDADGPDDLAGIMGGARSGISDDTQAMFLEMAIFDPACVAATGRKLNLQSDARYRFERGLDVTSPDTLMDYVAGMVLEICGGEASAVTLAGDGAAWQREIEFNPARTLALTGVDIEPQKQESILAALGFAIAKSGSDWQVTPPPWRGDIDGAADLVEEIIRVHGFDTIAEVPLPALAGRRAGALPLPAVDAAGRRPYHLRRLLASRGMMEAVTFSFLESERAARFGGGGEALQLVNPISADLDCMRPTPLPNLLAAAARNATRSAPDVALFEIGPAYLADGEGDQRMMAVGLRTGATHPRHWQEDGAVRDVDWGDAKADALAALTALGVNPQGLQAVAFEKDSAPDWYHPGQAGVLMQGRAPLARFGAVHPAVMEEYGLSGVAAAAFEIVMEDVPLPKAKAGAARPLPALSPYQPVGRDFAFIVDAELPAAQLLRAIRGAGKPHLRSAEIFDVYVGGDDGKHVAAGKKSVAVAVVLQSDTATLREADIAEAARAITDAVAKHCDGVLRE